VLRGCRLGGFAAIQPNVVSQFHEEATGRFVARIRLTDGDLDVDDLADVGDDVDEHLIRKVRREAAAEVENKRSTVSFSPSPTRSRGGGASRVMSAEDVAREMAGRGFDLNARPFGTFFSLLKLRTIPDPRERALPWCMRMIEEIYDERYKREQEILAEEEETGKPAPADKVGRSFPKTVIDYIKGRYGLRGITDRQCVDLVFNALRFRRDSVDCDVFVRFLEEYHDPEELLFFLYVRSVAQKVLGNVSFRSMWSEVGKGAGSRVATPSRPHMDLRQCSQVARIVFSSEADPHYRSFMAAVDEFLRAAHEPAVEVGQFLRLALDEYHDAHADDDEHDDDDEDASHHQHRRHGSESLRVERERDSSYTDRLVAQAAHDYEERMEQGGAERGAPAPEPRAPPSAASESSRRELLERMSSALRQANDEYIERLMQEAEGIPDEVATKIRDDLSSALNRQVDQLLLKAVTDTKKGTKAVSAATNPVGAAFYAVLSLAGVDDEDRLANSISDLCNVIISSDEIKAAMEPAVTFLIEMTGGGDYDDDEGDDDDQE
jgi:uncharacterized protein (DUF2267 family)